MVVYPPIVQQGRFHYPKELLLQHYMYRGGNGVWQTPGLKANELISENFISPMEALLQQLQREGHDVSAAKLEWLALREAASYLNDLGMKLCTGYRSRAAERESWDFDDEPPVA